MTDIERLRHSASHISNGVSENLAGSAVRCRAAVENGFITMSICRTGFRPTISRRSSAEMKKEIKAIIRSSAWKSRETKHWRSEKGRLAALDGVRPANSTGHYQHPAGRKDFALSQRRFRLISVRGHTWCGRETSAFSCHCAQRVPQGRRKNPRLSSAFGCVQNQGTR
jgi:hypothetical protein